MFKNLKTSLILAVAILVVQLPASDTSYAAEREKRKSQVASNSVGKKVNTAFEAYEVDDIKGAIEVLEDIDARSDFDKAYVARFTAIMYATLGEHEKEAIKLLKEAIAPDILNTNEHADSLKLLADLQMQTELYSEALANYLAWVDFTGKSDADVWTRIASAYYSNKELEKVIPFADKAIKAYGEKQSKNPYVLKLQSFYELKRPKEAVKVLERAVQIFPEEDTFWVQLANFYLLVEDYNKSMQTFELAYKAGYLVKDTHIKTLASLYQQNDIPFKAARLLEKYIKSGLVKKDKNTIMTLANAWHAASHVDKAANYYGELGALTKDPDHYSKQGMLLKQDEQFKAALVAFNTALKLGAKDKGRIHMSIAESYFYLEEYKEAYAAINKAMLDPKTKKSARGWVGFIADTAKRKGVNVKG